MSERHTSTNWTCREILHAGDGPPGKEEQVYSPHDMDAGEAAELFAEMMHDREAHKEGLSDSDFDDATDVVEVETFAGWKRFRVRCRLVRRYSAIEE